jgi:hypothetical protein
MVAATTTARSAAMATAQGCQGGRPLDIRSQPLGDGSLSACDRSIQAEEAFRLGHFLHAARLVACLGHVARLGHEVRCLLL